MIIIACFIRKLLMHIAAPWLRKLSTQMTKMPAKSGNTEIVTSGKIKYRNCKRERIFQEKKPLSSSFLCLICCTTIAFFLRLISPSESNLNKLLGSEATTSLMIDMHSQRPACQDQNPRQHIYLGISKLALQINGNYRVVGNFHVVQTFANFAIMTIDTKIITTQNFTCELLNTLTHEHTKFLWHRKFLWHICVTHFTNYKISR